MGFTLQVGSEVIGAPDLLPEVPEYNDVLEKVFATRQKWTYDELADLLHGLTSRMKSLVDKVVSSTKDRMVAFWRNRRGRIMVKILL